MKIFFASLFTHAFTTVIRAQKEVPTKEIYFTDGIRGTHLLMGEVLKTNQDKIDPGCITWVYEDGYSRRLARGGMDYHSALLNDNCSRFYWMQCYEQPGLKYLKEI